MVPIRIRHLPTIGWIGVCWVAGGVVAAFCSVVATEDARDQEYNATAAAPITTPNSSAMIAVFKRELPMADVPAAPASSDAGCCDDARARDRRAISHRAGLIASSMAIAHNGIVSSTSLRNDSGRSSTFRSSPNPNRRASDG